MKKAVLTALIAPLALAAFAAGAQQNFPTRPVRLIVPYPPGGNVDITARIIGPTLGELLGQTVVVDNRGGGGGNVGAHLVAKAAPDGHTLLMGSSGPLSINPVVVPNLPYDSVKDYAPVSRVHVVPLVVLAGQKSGISSIREMIERAKANPGTLTGSIGVVMQLANIEGLLKKVGVEYVVVKAGSYKDVGNFARTMSPEERKMLQALLDDVYSQFVGAVAEGRGLERSEVLAFAEGRIYSGQQALALKMVDEMGGFEDAVEAAGKLANITGRPKLVYPRKRFSFKDLLESRLGLPGAGSLLPPLSGIRTPLYLMQ